MALESGATHGHASESRTASLLTTRGLPNACATACCCLSLG